MPMIMVFCNNKFEIVLTNFSVYDYRVASSIVFYSLYNAYHVHGRRLRVQTLFGGTYDYGLYIGIGL